MKSLQLPKNKFVRVAINSDFTFFSSSDNSGLLISPAKSDFVKIFYWKREDK